MRDSGLELQHRGPSKKSKTSHSDATVLPIFCYKNLNSEDNIVGVHSRFDSLACGDFLKFFSCINYALIFIRPGDFLEFFSCRDLWSHFHQACTHWRTKCLGHPVKLDEICLCRSSPHCTQSTLHTEWTSQEERNNSVSVGSTCMSLHFVLSTGLFALCPVSLCVP
jgi:hypothetical protein